VYLKKLVSVSARRADDFPPSVPEYNRSEQTERVVFSLSLSLSLSSSLLLAFKRAFTFSHAPAASLSLSLSLFFLKTLGKIESKTTLKRELLLFARKEELLVWISKAVHYAESETEEVSGNERARVRERERERERFWIEEEYKY